jgi:hypothetical protein
MIGTVYSIGHGTATAEDFIGTLVDAGDHAPCIRRIDPQEARVGATRRPPERNDVSSAVRRFVHRRSHQVHDVRVLRVRVDLSAGARQLPGPEGPRVSAIL